MNKNTKIFETLKIENNIWIVYLILIGLSLVGNYFEKNYFLYNNEYEKNIYRNLNIFIFTVTFIIYVYLFKESYIALIDSIGSNNRKKFFNELNFISSLLIVVSGAIILYIAINDTNLDTEIALS